MKININLLNFFSKGEMNQMAKDSGLVVRKSPIEGFNFALTFTLGLLNTTNPTLKQLVAFLNNNCSENISPQALDERINETAVNFLKTCLFKAIELSVKKIKVPNELISCFSHIYIIDSTNFDLHPSLKDIFKGSSGSSSASSMRIQFVYDYMTGKFYVEIGDVRTTDAKTLSEIVKNNRLDTSGNTLFLQDLGYFNTETFISISNANKFFISKLKFRVTIYDLNGNEINIYKLLRMKPKKIDIKIKIGDLECRLVGSKLTKDIKTKRIQTAEKAAVKKGRKPISKEYKLFLSYGLFITNLSKVYSPKSVYSVYRLRWQIEIIFKTWKSILEIHKIHSAKEHRILCEVFGKLIVAATLMGIHAQTQSYFKRVLSYYQVFQYFKSIVTNWALQIIFGKKAHSNFLKKVSKQLVRFCEKRKQKTRPRIEDILSSLPSGKKKVTTKVQSKDRLAA